MAKSKKLTVLDEATSARVFAEYLSIRKVTATEIKAVENVSRGLSYREIAIAFAMSETLGVADPFAMAPRYSEAFALARVLMHSLRGKPADAACAVGGGQ